MKLLLLHLVGFYSTLPTLMMHGQTQIKFSWTDFALIFKDNNIVLVIHILSLYIFTLNTTIIKLTILSATT